jgi:aerobic carbon-monoxide dehydrogenase medium subunit
MKAPPFAYQRAATLADVFRLWAKAGPDAKLLAGGQSLMATLAFRLSEPTTLIDITRVGELKGVSDAGAFIRVGALTTHAELGASPLIKVHVPLAAETVPLIAHPAIRNRGTIGGSLAFADPAAELPSVVVALGARIIAASAKGERRIAAAEFFKGLYETALGEGELISAVELPKARSGERSAILELARRTGDYAMAGLAVRLSLDRDIVVDPWIVGFGVGNGPVLARTAMARLAGLPITPQTIAIVAQALDGDLDPSPDLHGSPAMKKRWARVLLERALIKIAGITDRAAA